MATDREPSAEQVEAVVDALLATTAEALAGFPGGRWHLGPGLVCYSTGQPLARLNGVALLDGRADERVADEWLAELRARGIAHCIMTRPGAPPWAAELAERSGLVGGAIDPLMWHPEPATVIAPVAAPTRFERVDPRDPAAVAVAQSLFADGFGGPLEVLGPMMAAEVIGAPGSATYVGSGDRGACVVGTGTTHDGYLGVFNIATPPAHRRRGHGAAMTAHVIREGARGGARTAYLQASADGYALYERMGFRTIEEWPVYYPVGADE